MRRRPDVVLFVNGLPLGLIELKNPAAEDATVWTAWQQLQTCKAELPTLFAMNAALIVSNGLEARIDTLTSGREWFKPWRTISGERLDYLADKEVTHERVEELGPVILMDGKKFERGLTDEGRKVTERIHAGMEGSGPGSARNADTTWAGGGSAPRIPDRRQPCP